MTDAPKPIPEIILLHETALQSWMRDASTLALIVALTRSAACARNVLSGGAA